VRRLLARERFFLWRFLAVTFWTVRWGVLCLGALVGLVT
jgi:hypothetical protein